MLAETKSQLNGGSAAAAATPAAAVESVKDQLLSSLKNDVASMSGDEEA